MRGHQVVLQRRKASVTAVTLRLSMVVYKTSMAVEIPHRVKGGSPPSAFRDLLSKIASSLIPAMLP
jgi:hypothetical protein